MRRFLTLALAAALVALVAVAAVDALRDDDRPPPEADARPRAPIPSWIDGGAAVAQRLKRDGVRGTLYLSADGCLEGNVRRLRALRLPELTLSEGPRSRTCSFSLSADGEHAAGEDAVWSPQDAVFAAATGRNELAVIAVEATGELQTSGSAPAFKPEGRLTHVRGGRIVEWTAACDDAGWFISPPVPLGPDPTGPYCLRTVARADELARALPQHVRLRGIHALAWASDSRMLAVLRTSDGPWLAAYEHGRPVRSASPHLIGLAVPRASADGEHVAVLARNHVEVYTRGSEVGWSSSLWSSSLETRAYDWSPDGEWLAYATTENVYLVRTSDWTTQFRFRLSTEALAWR